MEVYTQDVPFTIGNQLEDFAPSVPPVNLYQTGMITWYSSLNIPDGFLECNGQSVPITLYTQLYAIIGKSFDISGTPITHFCLPNFNGRTANTKGTLYTISGATSVVLKAENLPKHSHALTKGTTISLEPGGGAFPSTPVLPSLQNQKTTAPMKDENGNVIQQPPAPVPIMNPYISLIYIIKT